MKKKKSRVVILALVIVVVIGLVVVYIWKTNDKEEDNNSEKNNVTEIFEDNGSNDEGADKMMEIDTPYIALKYPENWSTYLKCEETTEDNLVAETFYCVLGEQKIRLFTVNFGDMVVGDFLGRWEGKDSSVAISIEIYELIMDGVQREEDKAIVYAMAEAVNSVVRSIEETEGFIKDHSIDVATESGDAEALQIETPYCTLEYPSSWEKYLTYQEEFGGDEKFITFYYEREDQKVELFTVYFGTLETGDLIGYISTENSKTAISVELANMDSNANLTEEEKNIVYAMRECVNDMIQAITASEGYTAE